MKKSTQNYFKFTIILISLAIILGSANIHTDASVESGEHDIEAESDGEKAPDETDENEYESNPDPMPIPEIQTEEEKFGESEGEIERDPPPTTMGEEYQASSESDGSLEALEVRMAYTDISDLISNDTFVLTEFLNVIENYPYSQPPVSIEKIDFEYTWMQSFYDYAYKTEAGANTPDHIVISGDRLTFYGYGSAPFMDAVFTDDYSLESFEFDFDPVQLNFHCFKRAGFWINSSISADGKISGYFVSMGSIAKGLEESNEKSYSYTLFEVTSMDIQSFNDYIHNETKNDYWHSFDYRNAVKLSTLYSLVDPIYSFPLAKGGTITQLANALGRTDVEAFTMNTPKMHFRIEVLDNSFQIYLTQRCENPVSTEILLFENTMISDTGRGFGFFMQNLFHNCARLTYVAYDKFYITATPEVEMTSARVNFRLVGTDIDIADAQIKTGHVNGEYKITPPKIEGYRYVGASRSSLDPLTYNASPAENITDLFYEKVEPPSVIKSARVLPYWEEDVGSEEKPVSVNAGDRIEYIITVITYEETTAATITDILPEGLKYIKSTGGNRVSVNGRTVTWEFDVLLEGETNVTVTAEVKEPGVYVNKAVASIAGRYELETNETHHEFVPKFNFNFYKVDISNPEKYLPGAQFSLYLWNGVGVAPEELISPISPDSDWLLAGISTSSDGIGLVVFEELEAGEYRLVEVKAPDGYELPRGQWRIIIGIDGAIRIVAVGEDKPPAFKAGGLDGDSYLVGNIPQYKLPRMGSRGSLWFAVLGGVLLTGGAFLMLIYRRDGQK